MRFLSIFPVVIFSQNENSPHLRLRSTLKLMASGPWSIGQTDYDDKYILHKCTFASCQKFIQIYCRTWPSDSLNVSETTVVAGDNRTYVSHSKLKMANFAYTTYTGRVVSIAISLQKDPSNVYLCHSCMCESHSTSFNAYYVRDKRQHTRTHANTSYEHREEDGRCEASEGGRETL